MNPDWKVCLSIWGSAFPTNIGALIIRIGFWGHIFIFIIRNPNNSIDNYSGPCITLCTGACFKPAASHGGKARDTPPKDGEDWYKELA